MADKALFAGYRGRLMPRADTVNAAGGPAYGFAPRHALAQLAATGCLSGTFHASAEEQLGTALDAAGRVDPEFVARTAVFARRRARMKDMPALLAAVLAVRSPALLAKVFDRVVDDGRMLRNFVQIVRSGVTGRKSLGSLPKRLVRNRLAAMTDAGLFRATVGESPSMADVVRMVHPRPADPRRAALYGWMVDRPHDEALLPDELRALLAYRRGEPVPLPDVPMQMLTALPLATAHWAAIARRASWTTLRMNLNTFARHGVFGEWGMTELVAGRLADPDEIRRAHAQPFQLLAASRAADPAVPAEVAGALARAAELAVDNVPLPEGRVVVMPDVSGSMGSAVTGARKGATSAVRCVDVAALIAAAVMKRCPGAEVIPFDDRVHEVTLPAEGGILANAEVLARFGGGGTDCAAPLRALNARGAEADLLMLVSDNQSWIRSGSERGGATGTLAEWTAFRVRNPGAKLVCLDIQPTGDTQAPDATDILNVGGFSDGVFEVVAEFAAGRTSAEHWVGVIERESL